MEREDHIIGTYSMDKPGPLFICVGGMHGNEPAGVEAIELLIKMMEVEHITNPAFSFHGTFIGLLGNPTAFKERTRFIDEDMNRQWNEGVRDNAITAEQVSIQRILKIIDLFIENCNPEQIYFLDLHTTSSTGGIFSIVSEDTRSLQMAQDIYAPIIKGFLNELQGTSLHYIHQENIGIPTTALVFEAGQHKEPLSVNRAIAAIICSMRHAGCVKAGDVENRHVEILKEYSKSLPGLTQLLYRHKITEKDKFKMLPNYYNFQKINKGETLAQDCNGDVVSPYSGMILLPLYQKKGSDGFFIVKSV